jgi:hypothetical protein
MSMEKGAAIVAKGTVAYCGRALMRTAAADSMQIANYTKVTPLIRPFAPRPVAAMDWKEVSCIRASQPANEKHTGILERIRNFIGLND